MAVKVTSESLPERQVKLQIEVDEDRHNEAIESAYKKLAPRVQIPGFRPGKAPRPLIEKQLLALLGNLLASHPPIAMRISRLRGMGFAAEKAAVG